MFHSSLGRRFMVASIFLLGLGTRSQAATFVVTSTGNTPGSVCGTDCTLSQAIGAANVGSDADTIVFDPVVFATKQTITIANEYFPPIMNDVSIVGPTAPGAGVTLRGGRIASGRNNNIFDVEISQGQVTLANLTVTEAGIGVMIVRGHTTVTNCTFSGNEVAIANVSAQHGTPNEEERQAHPEKWFAVLDESSSVVINNCTVSDNHQGVHNLAGSMVLNSCTIANNEVGVFGLGPNSVQTLSNCLVVGNKKWNTTSSNPKAPSTFTIDKYSVTTGTAEAAGLDPRGLSDNGGPTRTIALVAGSPAVGCGLSTLPTDQRGVLRSPTSGIDVGAFQTQSKATTSPA